MLIASLILYAILAFLVCACFIPRFTFSKFLLTFFLTAFSLNILAAELLSLLHWLDRAWAFLALQTVLCIFFGLLLWKVKPPHLREALVTFWGSLQDFRAGSYILLALAAGILLGFFFVGIRTPMNNMDSLHTHLVRIYYWLQHGSLADWPATGLFQLSYPVDAHLQGLWLFLLSRNEDTFFLVQWFSLAVICAAVYELARLLEFKSTPSLVAVLVLLSFPAALLQAYSFQGDLTVTALILVCVFFLFSYVKTRNLTDMLAAMLALALALGTKQTAFFTLPVIGPFVFYLICTKQVERKHLPYLAVIVAFFLVFSSYKYIQNLADRGSLFGQEDLIGEQSDGTGSLAGKLAYDLPRYLYQYIGFDGMTGEPQQALTGMKDDVFQKINAGLHIDLESDAYLPSGYDANERFVYGETPYQSEDTAWFGPLCFSLCTLGFIVSFFRKEKLLRKYLWFALLFNTSYILLLAIQRPGWDPYQGRYFLMAVLPFVPLIAALVPEKKRFGIPLGAVISVCALLLAVSTFLFNGSKPLITLRTATKFRDNVIVDYPTRTRLQRGTKYLLETGYQDLKSSLIERQDIDESSYYDLLYYNSSTTIPQIEMVNRNIDPGAPLYLFMDRDVLEYGLFGRNVTRSLYPVTDCNQVPPGGILIVSEEKTMDTTGFVLIDHKGPYSLYRRNS